MLVSLRIQQVASKAPKGMNSAFPSQLPQQLPKQLFMRVEDCGMEEMVEIGICSCKE